MQASNLVKLHKQMGNKIVECKDGKIYGYNIDTYKNYQPDVITLVNTVNNDVNKVISWDTAYDMLFGKPQAPDFTKVIA